MTGFANRLAHRAVAAPAPRRGMGLIGLSPRAPGGCRSFQAARRDTTQWLSLPLRAVEAIACALDRCEQIGAASDGCPSAPLAGISRAGDPNCIDRTTQRNYYRGQQRFITLARLARYRKYYNGHRCCRRTLGARMAVAPQATGRTHQAGDRRATGGLHRDVLRPTRPSFRPDLEVVGSREESRDPLDRVSGDLYPTRRLAQARR
jgi:hypothetical protein